MFLFSVGLRLACPSVPVFPRFPAPGVAASFMLFSRVMGFLSVVFVGSVVGILFEIFGWLVMLFRTCVLERDVSKHTQQVRARSARQIGDRVEDRWLVFFFLHRLSAPLGISNGFCGICLGLARSPCGVESSCGTLPRAGLVWRWPGPLFGCF